MDDDRRKTWLTRWFPLATTGVALFALATLCLPAEAQQNKRRAKSKVSRTKTKAPRPPAPPRPPMGFQQIDDAEKINLIAEGAVLLDAYSGEALYEKNGRERLFPASSTKILTALLVIEAGDLDREVEIVHEDTQVEPTSIGFKVGERFTRRQLLYALMLRSANDVAHALGRDNAGSVPAFAAKMTFRAQQLGAQNSQFLNPHGLHHPEHYSTPYDMALIARTAMQQPLYREIVGTLHYNWQSPRGITPLRNSNRLLVDFEGCTGGKTGYTRAARHVLACAALRDHREVISVVMRSDKAGKWTDSSQLLSYGLLHPPGPFKLESTTPPPLSPKDHGSSSTPPL